MVGWPLFSYPNRKQAWQPARLDKNAQLPDETGRCAHGGWGGGAGEGCPGSFEAFKKVGDCIYLQILRTAGSPKDLLLGPHPAC
jgi:hypothetical protein